MADGGVTWAAVNVQINDCSSYNGIRQPEIAFTPSGLLVAVWRDSRAGDNKGDIYLATSSNYGATWSANRRVDHGLYDTHAFSPVVAVGSSGQIYVIWQDDRSGQWDIYMNQVGG